MNRDDPRTHPTSVALEATRDVLQQLPREQRELIILLGFYRMTRDEISALLGQPLSRIDAVFRAAVRSLRSILAPPSRPTFA